MKTRNIVMIVIIGFATFPLVFCVPTQPTKLIPRSIIATYEMPIINALENYPELQEKGGTAVSVVPYSFTKIKRFNRKCKWKPSFLQILLKEEELDPDMKFNYQVTETPYYVVIPQELKFKIKLYNHMKQVLRLAGTIVQFQVEGNAKPLDKANYKEFIDGVIVPRQEKEFEIAGPPVDQLPNGSTIALFLWSITTESDAAGNPTKRSNFEWYFTFNKETMRESAEVNIKKMSLTPREARVLERRRR